MLIAVDIGNSSISVGFWGKSGLSVLKIPTHPVLRQAEYADLIGAYMADNSIEKGEVRCIISSVVVTHTHVLAGALSSLAGAAGRSVRILDSRMNLGIRLAVANPAEMGPDRMASAAGAYALYRRAMAVVDFGTATTVTVIDAEGNCLGGAIMAGLGMMNAALEAGTSRLRAVDLDPPEKALGRTTEENIRSGLFFGAAGAVEHILHEIEREAGCNFEAVVTGGHGQAMSAFLTRRHVVRPSLVLEGLRYIDEYN